MSRFARRSEGAGTRSGRESGQALIELALVAPIIILLLAGLVQFALIFETQIGIDNAIREAARRGATQDTPDVGTAQLNADWTLAQAVTLLGNAQNHDVARDSIEVCYFTPTADPNDPANNGQVDVRITDSYRHPVFLPIVDLILDGIDGVSDRSLAASASTEFHVEQTGNNNIGAGAAARTSGSTAVCTQ